ncbi:MAG: 2-hydroxychromene-2-carboxylate isomerase [Pusillimonas sp.]
MKKTLDYYFSVASPWTYLGHARLAALAKLHSINVNFYPVDFSLVLDATGGTLYQHRSEQRKQYRQVDLARWQRRLGIPLTLEPRYYPVDRGPASFVMIAARLLPQDDRFAILQAILKGIWHDEQNIADWDFLKKVLDELGLNSPAILASAQSQETTAQHTRDSRRAIEAGVFGVPSYVVDGEIFWGQDRLDFLEERLAETGH